MNVTALTPVGALVDDVRVDELDGPTVHLLQQALGEHGVVIMREQYADDTRFLRFLRSFGGDVHHR